MIPKWERQLPAKILVAIFLVAIAAIVCKVVYDAGYREGLCEGFSVGYGSQARSEFNDKCVP